MPIEIVVNPPVTADQLFDFYESNNVCEAGLGKTEAYKVIPGSDLIVAAFEGERLVGIARATFDGLSASVMEFSLETALQGTGLTYGNASLVEKDDSGVGKRLGRVFLDELFRMGATFIDYPVEPFEADFFWSIGFKENVGQLSFYIDRRSYVEPKG